MGDIVRTAAVSNDWCRHCVLNPLALGAFAFGVHTDKPELVRLLRDQGSVLIHGDRVGLALAGQFDNAAHDL